MSHDIHVMITPGHIVAPSELGQSYEDAAIQSRLEGREGVLFRQIAFSSTGSGVSSRMHDQSVAEDAVALVYLEETFGGCVARDRLTSLPHLRSSSSRA